MGSIDRLLHLAVEDNVAWCSAVCAAHASRELSALGTWANLRPSPRYYPNIITRQPGAQREVLEIAREVSAGNPSGTWGIKDSFCDLMLADQGFMKILAGNWYGGVIAGDRPDDWKTVTSSDGLRAWEIAWGGDEQRIFPDSLLSDRRISFWFKAGLDAVEEGFISFDSEFSLGLSNWFSLQNRSLAGMGALQAAGSVSRQRPVVCWSSDALTFEETGLAALGPLQVWLSKQA